MVNRRIPRPLTATSRPPRIRDRIQYAANRGNPGNSLASQQFDWDTALYRHALIMQAYGYMLSPEQRARINDH